MRPEPSNTSRAIAPRLEVHRTPQSGRHTLFELAEGGADMTRWPCGLEFLGGNLEGEFWQVPEPIEEGNRPGTAWRRSGGLMFLIHESADEHRSDPAPLAERAYTQLLELADEHRCPWPLRAWNFIPGINEGCGDEERYRRFCLGRARALKRAGFADSSLCAGTAIGGDQGMIQIMLLCGVRPGIQIENPRQVSAYHYPRIYGPASPSFARATALCEPDDSVLLLVSGTASVVGHETRHAGELDAQVDEILENLTSLLAASAARLERPQLARPRECMLFRAYVRHASDWPHVQERLVSAWPGCRVAGYRGDICRTDLLVEVEAVVRG